MLCVPGCCMKVTCNSLSGVRHSQALWADILLQMNDEQERVQRMSTTVVVQKCSEKPLVAGQSLIRHNRACVDHEDNDVDTTRFVQNMM